MRAILFDSVIDKIFLSIIFFISIILMLWIINTFCWKLWKILYKHYYFLVQGSMKIISFYKFVNTIIWMFFFGMYLSESNADLWMSILVFLERSDSFWNFPESSIFYTNMSFKVPSISVQCSRTLFYHIILKMVKHT